MGLEVSEATRRRDMNEPVSVASLLLKGRAIAFETNRFANSKLAVMTSPPTQDSSP